MRTEATPTIDVLRQLPKFLGSAARVWQPRMGGFSGAQLWYCPTEPTACLRAWPLGTTPERVAFVHRTLEALGLAGIDFVPVPWRWPNGSTLLVVDGRVWEVAPWLPGTADFSRQPTFQRLCAAMRAVARIHKAWHASQVGTALGPPSGILRRLRFLCELQDGLLGELHRRVHDASPPAREIARGILNEVERRLPGCRRSLERHADSRVPQQCCLRDLWHDHVLYLGEAVTGVVDFDAVATDSPAADLGRLLGSLVGDDSERWAEAFDAYESDFAEGRNLRSLARVYDHANVCLSGPLWLVWLWIEGRSFPDPQRVWTRMSEIESRLTAFSHWEME